jgi:hypothetical protein
LLQKRGLQLVARDANNSTLPEYPGLIVKDSYWLWPERDLAGNAIDFCMRVLQLQFLSRASVKQTSLFIGRRVRPDIRTHAGKKSPMP